MHPPISEPDLVTILEEADAALRVCVAGRACHASISMTCARTSSST